MVMTSLGPIFNVSRKFEVKPFRFAIVDVSPSIHIADEQVMRAELDRIGHHRYKGWMGFGFDMSNVRSMGYEGMMELNLFRKDLAQDARSIGLYALNTHNRNLLGTTHMDDFFPVYDSVAGFYAAMHEKYSSKR